MLPIVITFFSKVPQARLERGRGCSRGKYTGPPFECIHLCARPPQVIQNQRQRHTGQLAIITCALNVLGNIARVFTTLQVLDDPPRMDV